MSKFFSLVHSIIPNYVIKVRRRFTLYKISRENINTLEICQILPPVLQFIMIFFLLNLPTLFLWNTDLTFGIIAGAVDAFLMKYVGKSAFFVITITYKSNLDCLR